MQQEVGGWVTSSSSHYVTLGLERLTIATSAYGYSSSVKLDKPQVGENPQNQAKHAVNTGR